MWKIMLTNNQLVYHLLNLYNSRLLMLNNPGIFPKKIVSWKKILFDRIILFDLEAIKTNELSITLTVFVRCIYVEFYRAY